MVDMWICDSCFDDQCKLHEQEFQKGLIYNHSKEKCNICDCVASIYVVNFPSLMGYQLVKV